MALNFLFIRDVTDHYAQDTYKSTFKHEYSADSVIVTLSIALSLYNVLEMYLLMSSTFKRWNGLYFWSLLICNTGVMLYAFGMMLGYFELCIIWLWKVILDVGWVSMVFFQSMVLYSRLGLIVSDSRIVSGVKWMIIVSGILVCTIVVVLDFGNAYSTRPSFWEGYYYIEQIQLTWFTIQELIISGLYVWKTTAMLKMILRENTRSMIWQLLIINVIIISMDIFLVTLQFLHFQLFQEAIKAFVYSVKLKLELNILSKLVNLVSDKTSTANRSMTLDIIDSNAIVGQAQTELKRELTWPEHPSWLNKEEQERKRQGEIVTDEEIALNCSSSSQAGSDEISRVYTNHSRSTARMAGRETDMMYADLLRSMSVSHPK